MQEAAFIIVDCIRDGKRDVSMARYGGAEKSADAIRRFDDLKDTIPPCEEGIALLVYVGPNGDASVEEKALPAPPKKAEQRRLGEMGRLEFNEPWWRRAWRRIRGNR